MAEEKSRVRIAIDSLISNAIIFLKGEDEKHDSQPPLYTKEEKDELYGIKKDIERYPKHSSA
jgi:hypothetical protein